MIARQALSDRFELLERLPAAVAVEYSPAQRGPECVLHRGVGRPAVRAGSLRTPADGSQERLVAGRARWRRRREAAGAQLAASLRSDPVAGPRFGEGDLDLDLDHGRQGPQALGDLTADQSIAGQPTKVGSNSTRTRPPTTSTRC